MSPAIVALPKTTNTAALAPVMSRLVVDGTSSESNTNTRRGGVPPVCWITMLVGVITVLPFLNWPVSVSTPQVFSTERSTGTGAGSAHGSPTFGADHVTHP